MAIATNIRIPARQATIVLDACHSGAGTRDLSLSRPRYVAFDPGEPKGKGTRGLSVFEPHSPVMTAPHAAPDAGHKEWVTISGCRPDQTSADAWIRDGFYAGALTYHLVDEMKKATPRTTVRDMIEQVGRDLQAASFAQIPQVEGDVDQLLLGPSPPATEPERPPHAVLRRSKGRTVILEHVQSLNVGSIGAVYPPDDRRLEGVGIGRVKVLRVAGDSAEAVALDEMAVGPGYQVREIIRGLADAKLKLLLEAPDIQQKSVLADSLSKLDFVEVAAPGVRFDHRLHLSTTPTGWQGVVTTDGKEGDPVQCGDMGTLVAGLRPQLENAYAVKFLAGLDNPAPPFSVSVWADNGQTEPGSEKKLVQAKVGDLIRFNFKADRDCYLTLIDLGTSGKINVLFPNQYQPDGSIKAGQVYQTGTKGVLPFQIRATGPAGRELVKVIATVDSLALPSLKLGKAGAAGTRSIDTGSEFVRQLTRDLSVESIEETPQGSPLTTDRWATDYLIVEIAP